MMNGWGMWGMFGMVLLYIVVFWATLGILVVWAVKQFTTYGVPRASSREPDTSAGRPIR
jgi:hypothetical protein